MDVIVRGRLCDGITWRKKDKNQLAFDVTGSSFRLYLSQHRGFEMKQMTYGYRLKLVTTFGFINLTENEELANAIARCIVKEVLPQRVKLQSKIIKTLLDKDTDSNYAYVMRKVYSLSTKEKNNGVS